MHVGETALLKFDGVDLGCQLAKYATLDLFQKFLLLLIKDTCDNVWTISCSLLFLRLVWVIIHSIIFQQCLLYLWPVGIGSHGEKKIWFAKVSAYGHGVLKELIHVVSTARMGGRKDNSSSLLSHVCRHVVTMTNLSCCILYRLVEICPDS
jgi:hypothetical protein